MGLCNIKWEQLAFDGKSCTRYHDKNGTSNSVEQEQTNSNSIQKERGATWSAPPSVKKRGSSSGKHTSFDYDNDESKVNEHTANTNHGKSILIATAILTLIVIGAWFGYSVISTNSEAERKDHLVWEARKLLDRLCNDKTVDYLRLESVEYKDETVVLNCRLNTPWYSSVTSMIDSLKSQEFASIISLTPNRWDSICNYLMEAQVDMAITFTNFPVSPTISLPTSELHSIIHNNDAMAHALYYFVQRKKDEIKNYAIEHFRGDIAFNVDKVTVDKDFVTLFLLYDDSKARLGDSYTDSTRINNHFTDAIGDMGSILDGMWSICSRENKGFAFVYTGKKSHKAKRCEWNAEKACQVYPQYGPAVWHKGRKTNQVTTIIVKDKNK